MQDLASVFADTNVSVRTVLDAVGDVWFSCTDVAKAVGYENAQNAVSSLMPDRKNLSEISTPLSIGGLDFQAIFGNNWKAAKVINLEMLNDFLMDSGKPAAKAFRKWVTGTVLPSIQKTGSYSVKPAKPGCPENSGQLNFSRVVWGTPLVWKALFILRFTGCR